VLGPLLAAIPRAVAVVTGCLKFYPALFAEADGLQDTSDPWVSALRVETPTTYDVGVLRDSAITFSRCRTRSVPDLGAANST
jgi:hypothetical protein